MQTDDLAKSLVETLNLAAGLMRAAGLPNEMATAMERLASQVGQPCVVAVVGRVNAGKSTFINALLGEDLAVVGDVETTATINYFSYGTPNPHKPVRCHWHSPEGRVTEESKAFLDELQGNDLGSLRSARGIKYLEYLLPNPMLRRITLVDTPGTGGVVGDHQDRTAEFMQLSKELRARHEEDTRRLHSEADAVIYLVGSVALAVDKAFLGAFKEATGEQSRALNALGVMAKVDLDPEVVTRRQELAGKVAERLKDSLNTVVPVSAGLQRELDRLLEDDQAQFKRLMDALRSIPPETLQLLLEGEEFFCDPDLDCPVPIADRRELRGYAPWGVFATIAGIVAEPNLSTDAAAGKIRDIAGFNLLRGVLHRHFIERGDMLRYFRIVSDVRKILEDVNYTHLPRLRSEANRDRERLDRFVSFIQREDREPVTANELENFVRYHLDPERSVGVVEKLWREVEAELLVFYYRLIEDNADFEALQQLEDHTEELDTFSSEELTELRALLGLYGGETNDRLPPDRVGDIDYVVERQVYWHQRRMGSPFGTPYYALADRAHSRYGFILEAMLKDND